MNMEAWLEWARGPLFWTALSFMILGLLRQVCLTVWEVIRVYRRAGDKIIPLRRVAGETLQWLVPLRRLADRWPYSLTTFVFHLAVILVPVFLAGHVDLWRRGIGFSWPTLPNDVATWLTVAGMAAGIAAVIQRLLIRDSRAINRLQDYALPLFIVLILGSGFLVMHPVWNPLSRDAALLIHVLGGDLLLLLVPLTKLSHMILLPLSQLVSELAWHWPPDAGTRVAVTLGKEHEAI